MGTHRMISDNVSCPVSPLAWGCKKIQRVMTSTLAAETVSLSPVLDHLSWLRLCWGWMLDSEVEWKKPSQALAELPETFSTATFKSQHHPERLTLKLEVYKLHDELEVLKNRASSRNRIKWL